MTRRGTATFTGLVDLLSANLGGKALGASDDFFAACGALTNPEPAAFMPGKFTERGKWMDGWESRRRRDQGHDFCILELGARGQIRGFDVDTSHFNGNQPAFASVEGVVAARGTPFETLIDANWSELLPESRLFPDAQNLFAATPREAVTHVRLSIFPDGGVARLRAYGVVEPDFSERDDDATTRAQVRAELVDLAAMKNGGRVLACSDAHFAPEGQLLLPGRSPNMGGGWETRRRRGPGHDWIVIALGAAGRLEVLEVDTQHFKGNYPDRCAIDAIHAPSARATELVQSDAWSSLLEETKLSADHRHFFTVARPSSVTHLRLNIYPDGGVSRLRAWGTLDA